jgi:hypothetical protein
MSVTTSNVTVGTTATLLCGTDPKRRRLYIKNVHSSKAYFGPLGVTTSNGFHMDANESIVIENSHPADGSAKNAYYAVLGSGSGTVSIMEVTD